MVATGLEPTTFPFPFAIAGGRIHASGGDAAIRGKIIQVLFTAPGERVNLPEFGCGLFDLVFEPNGEVLQTTAEFAIGQALARWLDDDLRVDRVVVRASEATVTVEILYTRRRDLARDAVRLHFK